MGHLPWHCLFSPDFVWKLLGGTLGNNLHFTSGKQHDFRYGPVMGSSGYPVHKIPFRGPQNYNPGFVGRGSAVVSRHCASGQILRDNRRDPKKGPLILIPYATLIYPVYSLIKPLYNPKGPFKGLSFSPLKISRRLQCTTEVSI